MRKFSALLFSAVVCQSIVVSADALRDGFAQPPDAARPQAWWHWMNGNITKAGITADLEAMKQIGLGGATIVNVDCGVPRGTVNFMSPEWREDFKFAVVEANRLGLKLCVENCAGWSSSGGPWNTPANGMQCLTSSETRVQGSKPFDAVLPQPPTTLKTYHDVAVLAFKSEATEPPTPATFPAMSKAPLVIKRAFYETVDRGVTVDVTDKVLALLKSGKKRFAVTNETLGGDPASGQYKQLRFEFTLGDRPDTLVIDEHDALIFPTTPALLAKAQKQKKTEVDRTFVRPPTAVASEVGDIIPRDGVIDLTASMTPDGRLKWNTPPGDWVILRVGFTPIGIDNHPAPREGTGLECDKMSKAALDAHWAGFMQKVLDDIGPLAGKTLEASLIDSYEVGGQDWSPDFRTEFQKRRGYDPLKFLPAFTRRVIDTPAVTNRFLWDLRRTTADLFADNYFSYFNQLCHQHGLISAIEPYTGPFESLQCGQPADVVMGEFWTGTNGDPSVKLASSIAHIYGKTIVGAESFTAGSDGERWQADPYALKTLGDLMFCEGLNRYTFHRYAMQPWMNRSPGMTMGPYGLNFERTLTWWQQGKGWIDYITHCEYLLQQGRAVADLAYFTGESAPMEMPVIHPTAPRGYDYDAVNADVILHGATVKDGRVTLASGASYAAIILPTNDTAMTPAMLDGLRTLVRDGATVIGPRPEQAPGLSNYPDCDTQVKNLADELWGNCDGTKVLEHTFGKGRIIWGKSLADVFASQALKPDFEFHGTDSNLTFAHRIATGSDIYFVSNQRRQFDSVACTFRVSGKAPQLWYPDTGIVKPAPVWSERDGRTTVQLELEPAGSVFVVFGNSIDEKPHVVSAEQSHLVNTTRLEIQHAMYGSLNGSAQRDVTNELTQKIHDGQLNLTADNDALGADPAVMQKKHLSVDYSVDGKPAHVDVAEKTVLTLPAQSAADGSPQWELTTSGDGSPAAKLWSNGRVELHQSDQSLAYATATDVPTPSNISGAWTVEFPANWGAPPSVELPKLMSWTEHPVEGVRYFSGTATYRKSIDIDADRLTPHRELWLDLGTVKNFAEVSLNGHNLGVLWKPPFRVNITGIAKPGSNALVVQVTNLWPNRIIGDEHLPADVKWDDTRLAAWPQWLIDGKPSPTGRYTFSTWHHWHKTDTLLESGLIGPVTLRTAALVHAEPKANH